MTRHRICAIGNSHLAAAKLGWDRIKADHPDYRFDFFGFPPNSSVEFADHVAIGNGRLTPTTDKLRGGFTLTSGGLAAIVGSDYSAFVTFGMGVGGPVGGRTIYAGYRTRDFAAPGCSLISRPLLEAYLRQVCSTERALAPFRALRAISDAPIYLQSIPPPMTDILTAEKHVGDAHLIPDIYRHLRPIFEAVCADVGRPDLYTYLSQPAETLEPSGLTRPEFIRDGVGFSRFDSDRNKTNDYGHGNVAYGEVVMRALVAEFERAGLRERVLA